MQLTQRSEHENSGDSEGEGVALVVEGALVAGAAVQVGMTKTAIRLPALMEK